MAYGFNLAVLTHAPAWEFIRHRPGLRDAGVRSRRIDAGAWEQ
jgi:hypothetical protein